MKDRILELVRALGGTKAEDSVLDTLCAAACQRLDGMLREGVTPGDCAEAYVPAAAWLVLAWLGASQNWEGVTALSAGDMTVRREGGKGGLEQRAMGLMAPYLRDDSFVFQGVRG